MRVEVLHIAGPVPVRRQGVIEVGSLPAVTRDTVQRAVDAIRTQVSEAGAAPRAHGKGTAPPPIPDVGSSIVTIVDDDGAVTRLKFSEAEATLDQTRLLKALRPFLTIVPWK